MSGALRAAIDRLEAPSDVFGREYKEYLGRKGIHYILSFPSVQHDGQAITPYYSVAFLRNSLAGSLQKALPEPQASLSQGMLLDLRGKIPNDLLDTFANTGTTHILAISGQDFSMVISLLILGITKLVGRRHPMGFSVLLLSVWLYAALTGMPPSVLRAAIMVSLVLLALFVGRQPHLPGALLFSAAIMAALDPSLLLDIGFQLSFLATAGVLFITPLLLSLSSMMLDRLSKSTELIRLLLGLLLAPTFAGLGAWLTTAPVIFANFGAVSLISIPATLSILPSFAPLIFLSAAVSVLGLISLTLAQPVAWLTWLSASYMIWGVKLWEGLSRGAETASWSIAWPYSTVYYLALCYIVWRTSSSYRPHIVPLSLPANGLWPVTKGAAFTLIMVTLIAGNLLVIWLHFDFDRGRLEVTFIDVGQGDSTLIRTPRGKTILIDGGPDPDLLANRLGKLLPFWQRNIDLVVLTHPQRDHLAGLLGVIGRYNVGNIVESETEGETGEYRQWRRMLEDRRVPVTRVSTGGAILLDKNIKMEVLHPNASDYPEYREDVNNRSLVLRLVSQNASFLFTGDIEESAENELVYGPRVLASSVLKIPHHGSNTSSTRDFLDKVSPQVAVISVGANNTFGHPHPDVLERLENVRTFRLDQDGSVRFKEEERMLRIKRQR